MLYPTLRPLPPGDSQEVPLHHSDEPQELVCVCEREKDGLEAGHTLVNLLGDERTHKEDPSKLGRKRGPPASQSQGTGSFAS